MDGRYYARRVITKDVAGGFMLPRLWDDGLMYNIPCPDVAEIPGLRWDVSILSASNMEIP